jgi:hypothetical protein
MVPSVIAPTHYINPSNVFRDLFIIIQRMVVDTSWRVRYQIADYMEMVCEISVKNECV